MPTDRFVASVQYNDWKGTSAADSSAERSPETWLEEQGHKEKGEFLIGIKVWAGEFHGAYEDPISVEFLLVEAGDYDTVAEKLQTEPDPIDAKRVSVDMSIAEFLGLFKRFAITLSRDRMFEGREYSFIE